MLILLPPSEGKRDGEGVKLKPTALSYAKELSKPRAEVMAAVEKLAQGPAAKAREVLGLSVRQSAEIERDAHLTLAPTSPAINIYSGVLFEALDWDSLSPGAKKRGEKSLLIMSALFGVIRPQDRIPAYRLSMDVALPKIGSLAKFWQKHLATAIKPISNELIIDCRSTSYAAAWAPPASNQFTVKVMRKQGRKLVVVSHMAKQGRGVLARLLLANTRTPRSIDDVASIAESQFRVEISDPVKSKPGSLILITK